MQSETKKANSNSGNVFGIVVPKPSGKLDEPTMVVRYTYSEISKDTRNEW